MDDANVFERLVADEMARRAGPEPIVDDAGSDHRLVERDDLVDRQAWVELWVQASVVSYDVHVPPQVSTASFFFP